MNLSAKCGKVGNEKSAMKFGSSAIVVRLSFSSLVFMHRHARLPASFESCRSELPTAQQSLLLEAI